MHRRDKYKWSCRRCTLPNSCERSTCEACGNDSPIIPLLPKPSWSTQAQYGQLAFHLDEPGFETGLGGKVRQIVNALNVEHGSYLGLKIELSILEQGGNGHGRVLSRQTHDIPKSGRLILPTELSAGRVSAKYMFGRKGPLKSGPESKPDSFVMPSPIKNFKVGFDAARCEVFLSWTGQADLEICRGIGNNGNMHWRPIGAIEKDNHFCDPSAPRFEKIHYRLVCNRSGRILAHKSIQTLGPPKKPTHLEAIIDRNAVILKTGFSGKPLTTRAEWVLQFEDDEVETITFKPARVVQTVWRPHRFGRVKVALIQWHKSVKRQLTVGELNIGHEESSVQVVPGPRCLLITGTKTNFCRSISLSLLRAGGEVAKRLFREDEFKTLFDELDEDTQYQIIITESFFSKEKNLSKVRVLSMNTLPRAEPITDFAWHADPWRLTWTPIFNANLMIRQLGLPNQTQSMSGYEVVNAESGYLNLSGLFDPPALIEAYVNQYGQVVGPVNLFCMPGHSASISENWPRELDDVQLEIQYSSDFYGGKLEIKEASNRNAALFDFSAPITIQRQVRPWTLVELETTRIWKGLRSEPVITRHLVGAAKLCRFFNIEWPNPADPVLIFDPPERISACHPRMLVEDGTQTMEIDDAPFKLSLKSFSESERHRALIISLTLDAISGPITLNHYKLILFRGPEARAVQSSRRWTGLIWRPQAPLTTQPTFLEYNAEGTQFYTATLPPERRSHVLGPVPDNLTSVQARILPARPTPDVFIGPAEVNLDRQIKFSNLNISHYDRSTGEMTLKGDFDSLPPGGELLFFGRGEDQTWYPIKRTISPGRCILKLHNGWRTIKLVSQVGETNQILDEYYVPSEFGEYAALKRLANETWMVKFSPSSVVRKLSFLNDASQEQTIKAGQRAIYFETPLEWAGSDLKLIFQDDQMVIVPFHTSDLEESFFDHLEYESNGGAPAFVLHCLPYFFVGFDSQKLGIELVLENQETMTYWVHAGRKVRLPAPIKPPPRIKVRVWRNIPESGMALAHEATLKVYRRPTINKIQLLDQLNTAKLEGVAHDHTGEIEGWAFEPSGGENKISRLQVQFDKSGRFAIIDSAFRARLCPTYKIIHKTCGTRLVTKGSISVNDHPKTTELIIGNILEKIRKTDCWGCSWPDLSRLKRSQVDMTHDTAAKVEEGLKSIRKEERLWGLNPLEIETSRRSKRWLWLYRVLLLLGAMHVGLGPPWITVYGGIMAIILLALLIKSLSGRSCFGGFWCFKPESGTPRMPHPPGFLKSFAANLRAIIGQKPNKMGLYPVETLPIPLQVKVFLTEPSCPNDKSRPNLMVGNRVVMIGTLNPLVFTTKTSSWLLNQVEDVWEASPVNNSDEKIILQPDCPVEIDGTPVTVISGSHETPPRWVKFTLCPDS
jgi:hypothetical protein